ncbi:DUF3368 domain-containing protein [bacterium]|nr:DUF3368 domain-containing protein [bacterium]
MIVVCDTSPLHYLILVNQERLVHILFQEVVTTPEVIEEMLAAGAPQVIKGWASSPPSWLEVRSAQSIDLTLQLGKGESSAISLASELQQVRTDVILLIDERDGRQAAKARGLKTAGTLAILSEAARMNLVELPAVISQLQKTSFHIKTSIVEEVLRLDRERKRSQQGDAKTMNE